MHPKLNAFYGDFAESNKRKNKDAESNIFLADFSRANSASNLAKQLYS
ncbi:MAG: hypothetical protein AB4080_21985 [Trichodesmium sp.]